MGARVGLWHKGTKGEEFAGSTYAARCWLKEGQIGGEEQAKQNICTNEPGAYILNQINKLPKQKQEEFWSEYSARKALRKDVQAELIAASRLIFDQDDNTQFEKFGLHKI